MIGLADTQNVPFKDIYNIIFSYIDGTGQASDVQNDMCKISRRLLWVMANYISSATASHGCQLGYIEGDNAESLLSHIEPMADLFPTKMILKAMCFKTRTMTPYVCGGMLSKFEKFDQSRYDQNIYLDDAFGMLLVSYDEASSELADYISTIISSQRLLSHVIIIRPRNSSIISYNTLIENNWAFVSVGIGGGKFSVDVYINQHWEEELRLAGDRRKPSKLDLIIRGAPKECHVVPTTDTTEFGNAAVMLEAPPEQLCNPNVFMYFLGEDGELRRSRNIANVESAAIRLYLFRDVCLSFEPGGIWRGEKAFYGLSGFSDTRTPMGPEGLAVPAPTTDMKGFYFLAQTGEVAHSHLMQETLKNLHHAKMFPPNIKLLASSMLTSSQREYFQLFGFPPERCVYREPDKTVRVEWLVVPQNFHFFWDRVSANYLYRIGLSHYEKSPERPRRIYISRRDARSCRNMINELEIENIFVEYGFKVLLTSEMSAIDKLEIFSSAEYIATSFGAAVHYSLFSANPKLILLTSDLYMHYSHFQIVAARQFETHIIKGFGMKFFSDWGYEHSSFYVPPGIVRKVLAALSELQDPPK